MDLSGIKKIHFIGIGGIGVSAIARMALLGNATISLSKCRVSGSDMHESLITRELKKLGAQTFVGHRAGNLKEADLVVYSRAIPDANPEMVKAKKLGILALSYPEMLGEISRGLFTIAVSGTHGKTTTTAMIGKILVDAGYDPTVIVGSLMKDVKSNLIVGKSKYLVVEACEYRRSFLNLHPNIIIITNIDKDHLDYYKDLNDIKKAFREFAKRLVPGGHVITQEQYSDINLPITLKVPGVHNQKNAQAALAATVALGVREGVARKALAGFAGTWRRIEKKGKTATGATLYDDYAHAPDEVRATLAALRGLYPKKRIVAVFQPHLYSRTKLLLKEFGTAFSDANEVVVTDIYAAREKLDKTIHAKDLVAEIKKHTGGVHYMKDFSYIKKYLLNTLKKGDIIVTMGAGSICDLAGDLVDA